MAFQEGSSPTLSNFASGTSGQTNTFFMPEVYSKNVQMFFRKAAVVEAVTNTDYTGEISAYGDTVKIIKEPTISVNNYTRNLATTRTVLTDQELVLTVDQARHFHFNVDDIEKKMSHVNWVDVASKSAAYALKDDYDVNVFAYMAANVDADMVLGYDDATADDIPNLGVNEAVHIGFASGTSDPIDVLARLSRMLDDNNVPEEGRWVVAPPAFYEVLSLSSSKLLSVDYNAGQGSIRNGLVTSGLLRGFKMYKSNNLPTPDYSEGILLAGHISAVATANTLLSTEVLRSQEFFGDIVRGLHVFGRKVLREDALAKVFWNTTSV